METFPSFMDITAEQAMKLRQLEEKKVAIQNFINTVMQQGQQLMENYNSASKSAWQDIARETGIDIVNTIWVPHPSENKIVPVQVSLNRETLTPEGSRVN